MTESNKTREFLVPAIYTIKALIKVHASSEEEATQMAKDFGGKKLDRLLETANKKKTTP